ncbi:hypothetical protein EDB81DRAFT_485324 [Dactylonectria macrodidyma]|uniref:Zn(2)-C6 fungal-type domain-containing protein n=1 Tax=Dactylonectria macrodidyma TaxID=307937 RepID=A0A9P9EVZ2_9HYPO|nr:hypothetical protein EDB81DRAFT_485324 [Dactylonectria macrodidyma]
MSSRIMASSIAQRKPAPSKKFATPPAKSACTACRASRLRCSGQRPCSRCLAKSRICVFTESRRGLKPDATRPAGQPACHFPVPGTSLEAAGLHDPYPKTQRSPVFVEVPQEVLPPLYNDDLGTIQFDDIFGGDSNDTLDTFFASLFSLPSYPPAGVIDEPVFDGLEPSHTYVLRRYKSDDDVVQAYYELIHPAFPILPPPLEQDVEDRAEPWVPTGQFFSDYEPSSPLILALLSILVLLPHPHDYHSSDETGRELRAAYAQSLTQRAIESIKIASEIATPASPSSLRSPAHPHVPLEIETPMALCLISMYQYLHHGNATKMRQMAEEAFDSSVKLSLHIIPHDDTNFAEARRRTWWMTYLCMCNASIISCEPPTRLMITNTFKTPYPSTENDSEVWRNYIRAEETLVSATLLLVALLRGFSSATSIVDFRQNIHLLNTIIESQLDGLDSEGIHSIDSSHPPEVRVGDCLRRLTWIRLTSSHIKTHRYRAFMSSAIVLKRFESLPSSEMLEASTTSGSTSNLEEMGIASRIFPFAASESRTLCLESSTKLASSLKILSSNVSVAPFACSAALAGYTALMTHHFTSSSTDYNESQTKSNAVREQCEQGVMDAINALDNFSVGFESMRTLNGDCPTLGPKLELRPLILTMKLL